MGSTVKFNTQNMALYLRKDPRFAYEGGCWRVVHSCSQMWWRESFGEWQVRDTVSRGNQGVSRVCSVQSRSAQGSFLRLHSEPRGRNHESANRRSP